MSYCILRAEKLTSMGNIAASAGHTFRELPTPNADPERTHLNVTIGAKSAKAVCAAIKARLPEKRRKDAVLCIEYLITASPEWFKTATNKQQNDYFRGATKWLEDRHGKENIVCLNMQNDETSPHMVAYVVPLTKDGRLSAKDFLGGKAKLTQMQSDFHKRVGEPVGLQRGVEGSKAEHTTTKQYYTALQKNPTLQPPKPPAPTMADRVTGRAKKLQEEHDAEMAEYAAQVQQARNVALLGRKARQQQAKAVEDLRERVEGLEDQQETVERLQKENRRLRQVMEAEQNRLMEIILWLWRALLAVLGLSTHWEHEAGKAADEAATLRQQLVPKRPTAPKPAPRPIWARKTGEDA